MMGKTRHHIRPKSRGGSSNQSNIMLVEDKQHRAYHILFINALPEEAIMILINKWFYKNKQQKIKALRKVTMELAHLVTTLIEEDK